MKQKRRRVERVKPQRRGRDLPSGALGQDLATFPLAFGQCSGLQSMPDLDNGSWGRYSGKQTQPAGREWGTVGVSCHVPPQWATEASHGLGFLEEGQKHQLGSLSTSPFALACQTSKNHSVHYCPSSKS